jgi:hypothetical protein
VFLNEQDLKDRGSAKARESTRSEPSQTTDKKKEPTVLPLQVLETIVYSQPSKWKNKNFLHQKYVEEWLSIRQIASDVMSSKETVRKELLRTGIKLRERSHHNGNPSQVRLGQRVVKRKLVEHKTEQRVVDSVLRMKKEGLGLRVIARCLDEMKAPTKQQGRKWPPEMVRRILT